MCSAIRFCLSVYFDLSPRAIPLRPQTPPSGSRRLVAMSLRSLTAFQSLTSHLPALLETDLRRLFAADPERGARFALEAEGIYFDYAKSLVTDETLALLVNLAQQAGVEER